VTDYSGIEPRVGAAWRYAARALIGLAASGFFVTISVLALWALVVFLYSNSLESL
jgi:hypothetical protein